ncbi:MAG: amino acid ABC transporter substrate-binding protein [Chloroflexi bacterium]|nr:amino acid ABC transporter substrate-binding protein [Chloroflexota bacterium]
MASAAARTIIQTIRAHKRLSAALALLALAGVILYAATRPPPILLPYGELRIAVDASYPPFAVATADDLWGIDIEIGRALGTRLGAPVRFVNMGFDGLYDALRTDQVDIVLAALIPNAARRGQVRYTRAYFDAGLVLVGGLTRMEESPGRRIAYEFGSVGDQEVRRWQRLVEQPFMPLPYELPQYALDAARLGVADAALVDAVSVRLYLREHAEWRPVLTPLTHTPYVIAVRLDRTTLFEAVDAALAEMLQEGAIEAILRRYL